MKKMAACSTVTSKICITAIGLLFWGASAALIFLGAWVFNTYHHYNELTTANLTLIPATILIAVGVVLFILGCVGCCAAFKEHKCLLACFFSVLLIVLTAEVCAGALGYVFRSNMETAVEDGLTKAVNKYMNGTTQKDQIDYLQQQLTCCGIYNGSDWESSPGWNPNSTRHNEVPESCCRKGLSKNCTNVAGSKDVYHQGCLSQLEGKFKSNLNYIAGIALAFAVIQLLGMICTCILFCRSTEVRYETLGGPNSGLRV